MSKKKKNKQVNAYLHKSALKHKGKGMKRLTFFTSSQRKQNNALTQW